MCPKSAYAWHGYPPQKESGLRSPKKAETGGSVYLCIPWKKYTLIFSAPTSTVLAFFGSFPFFLLYFSSINVKKEKNKVRKGPKSDQCILVYTLAPFPNRSAKNNLSDVHNDYAPRRLQQLADGFGGPKYTQVYTSIH